MGDIHVGAGAKEQPGENGKKRFHIYVRRDQPVLRNEQNRRCSCAATPVPFGAEKVEVPEPGQLREPRERVTSMRMIR